MTSRADPPVDRKHDGINRAWVILAVAIGVGAAAGALLNFFVSSTPYDFGWGFAATCLVALSAILIAVIGFVRQGSIDKKRSEFEERVKKVESQSIDEYWTK